MKEMLKDMSVKEKKYFIAIMMVFATVLLAEAIHWIAVLLYSGLTFLNVVYIAGNLYIAVKSLQLLKAGNDAFGRLEENNEHS